MKYQHLLLFQLVLLVLVIAGNPDCENYESVQAVVSPIAEDQLLVKTFSDFLENRELYADVNGEERYQATYEEAMLGSIVTINAEEISESLDFFVKDTDCGGFIPLNATFQCDSFEEVEVEVMPKFGDPGEEVLVRTNPTNLLKDRKLYLANSRSRAPTPLEFRFNDTLRGACLLYTSPSPRDLSTSRMPSSA